MTDFRALCIELTDCLEKADWPNRYKKVFQFWVDIARAALVDEPAVPQPQPPAEGKVAELVVELRMMASQAAEACQFTDAENLSRAADLLQRLSPPQPPVPVSERLPGPEDCDAEGRCWWGRNESDDWSADWTLATHEAVAEFCEFCPRTVWLPAHALPIPQQQQENTNG